MLGVGPRTLNTARQTLCLFPWAGYVPEASTSHESSERSTSLARCFLGRSASHVHFSPSMHLGRHHTSTLMTGIQAGVVCGGVTVLSVWLWGPWGTRGAVCPYPSQAGENRELPLESSEPNGFHRIFDHESVWGGEGGGEEGSTHLSFVIVWHLGWSPDRLISCMCCHGN